MAANLNGYRNRIRYLPSRHIGQRRIQAISSRLEIRRNISGVGFGLGGSVFINDRPAGDVNMYGPFYYLNLDSGRFIYLGEIDWLDDESPSVTATSFATTHKLSYMLTQGFYVEGQYDFYDPDIDMVSGDIKRYGLGFNYYPYGFLEVSPMFRIYNDKISDEDYILFNSQIHFFF
jgi:hypothetical protein